MPRPPSAAAAVVPPDLSGPLPPPAAINPYTPACALSLLAAQLGFVLPPLPPSGLQGRARRGRSQASAPLRLQAPADACSACIRLLCRRLLRRALRSLVMHACLPTPRVGCVLFLFPTRRLPGLLPKFSPLVQHRATAAAAPVAHAHAPRGASLYRGSGFQIARTGHPAGPTGGAATSSASKGGTAVGSGAGAWHLTRGRRATSQATTHAHCAAISTHSAAHGGPREACLKLTPRSLS